MRLLNDETDANKIRHRRYQLYFKNIRVEHGDYALHSKGNRLLAADGSIVESLAIDVDKPMPEKQALTFALADQQLTESLFKGKAKLPKGELILARNGVESVRSNYVFAYVFDIRKEYLELPLTASKEPFRIYVDAGTGSIIRRLSLIHSCASTATGSDGLAHVKDHHTLVQPSFIEQGQTPQVAATFTPLWGGRYGSSRSFETERSPDAQVEYRLWHQNGALITKRDTRNPGGWDATNDVTNSGNVWGTNEQNATTAHWLAQQTYNFFQATFARNGYDNNYRYPHILVNSGGNSPYIDDVIAYWDRVDQLTFGYAPIPSPIFGDIRPDINKPYLTADIMGHEYMHAVTQNSVPNGLSTSGEPKALNESISDIFGTAFERYLFPNNWNWDFAEDMSQLRDMANPRRAFPPLGIPGGQPSIYLDPNGWSNDPYAQMGVMNKWFHTLCTGQGPNNQNINPISFDEAIQIVYHAVRFHLKTGSGFPHARDVTAQAAHELFGDCSAQERAVVAAWGTAGLATIGCGSTCTLPTNTCYTIKVESSGKRLQAINSSSVEQQPANGGSNQIWRVEDRGNGRVSFTAQDGSFKAIRVTNGATTGELLSLGAYVANGQQNWAVQCNPAVANQWRVVYSTNNNTWDVQNFGNNPPLQIYGTTQESFQTYRAFQFEQATCPNISPRCDYRVTMVSSLVTATCGESISFNTTCEGTGCSGVTLQWSGQGIDNQTGPSVSTSTPGSAGMYLYKVESTKIGCGTSEGGRIVLPVYCGGQVCSPPANGCYNIVSATTGNRLQAMTNNTAFDQPTNNANNQIWRIDNRGNGRVSFTIQDGTNRTAQVSDFAANGFVTLNTYVANSSYEWGLQCNPTNTSQWRVFSAKNRTLWDVTPTQNRDRVYEPVLATNSDVLSALFRDYQKFFFQPATCPTTPNCNFAASPSISDGNTNRSCNQAVTLNANCSGNDCSGVSYSWSGTGVPANSTNSSVTFNGPGSNGTNYIYTVTTSKAGCSQQTAIVNFNVGGCSTNGGGTSVCIEAETGQGTMSVQNNSNASGGQFYGNFGDDVGYVNYPINVPTAGNYTIQFTYSYPSSPVHFNLLVNNGPPQLVALPASPGFYDFITGNATVALPAGNSTLTLRGINNYFFFFDKFCIQGGSAGGGSCNFAVSPSPSDGNTNRACSLGVTLNANCSGSDCGSVSYSWSGNGIPANSNGSSVNFNVPGANSSYQYTVTASKAGCGNQTGAVSLNVSGCGGGGTNTCIEAESGQGNVSVQNNSGASGGQYYGNFGDNVGYVNYAINLATAGNYTMPITYGAAEATTVNLVVNNGSPQLLSLPSTGGWLNFATQNVMVSLPAGSSTLSFRAIANQFLFFDKFCLMNGGRMAAQEPTETGLDLRVAPNPSNGRFTVHFRTQIGQTATLRLSDLNGRTVRTTQTIMGTGGTHAEAIVLPASVHGVLLIDVVSGSQRASQKIIIE